MPHKHSKWGVSNIYFCMIVRKMQLVLHFKNDIKNHFPVELSGIQEGGASPPD